MFFFVLTSHSVGSPFIADTMLRSGVPPHIGQSPVPGSEAASLPGCVETAATIVVASTKRYTFMFECVLANVYSLALGAHHQRVSSPLAFARGVLSASRSTLISRLGFARPSVPRHLEIVQVGTELHIHEYAW